MVLIASDIPLLIIGLIASFVVILLSLGYVYRSSFPMSTMWFISGAIFLLIFMSVNTISIGYTDERDRLENSTITANTTEYEYLTEGNTPITYDIKVKDVDGNYTMEPNFVGIMLIILSLSFIMVGVLIERD